MNTTTNTTTNNTAELNTTANTAQTKATAQWNKEMAINFIRLKAGNACPSNLEEMSETLLVSMAKELSKVALADAKAKAKEDALKCPQNFAKPYELVKEVKSVTIGAMIEMIDNDAVIRDFTYQRTPSHTNTVASSIIDTILKGAYLPPIALVSQEDGTLSIADGSSRLWDFQRFYSDDLKIQKKWTFSDLSENDQNIFLNYPLTCEIVSAGATGESIFKAWNSAVSLSGAQKTKSELGDNVRFVNFVADHAVWGNVFTERMLQKDSPIQIAEVIIAHLSGCYAGTGKALAKNISENENVQKLNYEKIKHILDVIDGIISETPSKFNKYAISSLVRLAYADERVLTDENAVMIACTADLPTAGSNSPKTQDEFLKQIKSILNRQKRKARKANTDEVTETEQSAE